MDGEYNYTRHTLLKELIADKRAELSELEKLEGVEEAKRQELLEREADEDGKLKELDKNIVKRKVD